MGLGRNRGNTPGEVVMEMVSKRSWPVPGGLFAEYSKTMQMRRREVDRYLIELAEQKTWIEGVRFMLTDPRRSPKAMALLPGRTHRLGAERPNSETAPVLVPG
jgi:hypothetical protein